MCGGMQLTLSRVDNERKEQKNNEPEVQTEKKES